MKKFLSITIIFFPPYITDLISKAIWAWSFPVEKSIYFCNCCTLRFSITCWVSFGNSCIPRNFSISSKVVELIGIKLCTSFNIYRLPSEDTSPIPDTSNCVFSFSWLMSLEVYQFYFSFKEPAFGFFDFLCLSIFYLIDFCSPFYFSFNLL